MEQRLSLVTLGVSDLPRAVAFGKMQAMVAGAAIVRHELTGQRVSPP